MVIEILLKILIPKSNHRVFIIKECKDFSTLDFNQLIRSLMSHEERLRETISRIDEKDFSSKETEARSSGKKKRSR